MAKNEKLKLIEFWKWKKSNFSFFLLNEEIKTSNAKIKKSMNGARNDVNNRWALASLDSWLTAVALIFIVYVFLHMATFCLLLKGIFRNCWFPLRCLNSCLDIKNKLVLPKMLSFFSAVYYSLDTWENEWKNLRVATVVALDFP